MYIYIDLRSVNPPNIPGIVPVSLLFSSDKISNGEGIEYSLKNDIDPSNWLFPAFNVINCLRCFNSCKFPDNLFESMIKCFTLGHPPISGSFPSNWLPLNDNSYKFNHFEQYDSGIVPVILFPSK